MMKRKLFLLLGALLLIALLAGRAKADPFDGDEYAAFEDATLTSVPEEIVLEFWEEEGIAPLAETGEAGPAPGAVFNTCKVTASPVRYRNPPFALGLIRGEGTVVCQYPVEQMYVTVGLVRDDFDPSTPPTPVVVRLEQARLPVLPETSVIAASREPRHICSKWTDQFWGYTTEVAAFIQSRGVFRNGRVASREIAVKCF